MEDFKKTTIEIPVRFRDVDAMGHVNNAVYFTYFEEGRKALLLEVLGIVDPADYSFILASIRCDFRKAVRMGDHIALDIWVGEIGRRSFTFKYSLRDVKDPGIQYASGESVQVSFDYKANKSCPIPEELAKKIQGYKESPRNAGRMP